MITKDIKLNRLFITLNQAFIITLKVLFFKTKKTNRSILRPPLGSLSDVFTGWE